MFNLSDSLFKKIVAFTNDLTIMCVNRTMRYIIASSIYNSNTIEIVPVYGKHYISCQICKNEDTRNKVKIYAHNLQDTFRKGGFISFCSNQQCCASALYSRLMEAIKHFQCFYWSKITSISKNPLNIIRSNGSISKAIILQDKIKWYYDDNQQLHICVHVAYSQNPVAEDITYDQLEKIIDEEKLNNKFLHKLVPISTVIEDINVVYNKVAFNCLPQNVRESILEIINL